MMRLGRQLRYSIGFDVVGAFRGLKSMVRAPIKHFKSMMEPSGTNYSTQIQITAEGYDEVAGEWQAYMGHHPYDMMIYNMLENSQQTNFGTIDNPCVVFTPDTPFRYIACTGPQNEEDYESHEMMWMMLREGPLQRCLSCGQVFKLVRLRDEDTAQMNYYMPNFNMLWHEDVGELDIPVMLNPLKLVTHYDPTLFESPEDTYHYNVNADDHDRILTDPAYRLHKQTECAEKVKIYQYALRYTEFEKELNDPYKQPISKNQYVNLLQAQITIRKLDRIFRRIVRYNSRRFVDPINHARREKRMLERSKKRWDGAYTLFTGHLTEEQLRYKDYFESDLQAFPEDELVQEMLDKEELLSDPRYKLSRYDFIEGYTYGPQDDQTTYIEKKIFKFRYRKALDSQETYERRNRRMIEAQRKRFAENNSMAVVENYLRDNEEYSADYFKLIGDESVKQYKDYFQTENDPFDEILFDLHKSTFAVAFENTQLAVGDRDTHATYKLPEWNKELGFWPNAVAQAKEVLSIRGKIQQIEGEAAIKSLESKAINPQ